MDKIKEIAEVLLDMFELEEILEMNDLTPHEVLERLIEGGLIGEPSRILEELEGDTSLAEEEELDV